MSRIEHLPVKVLPLGHKGQYQKDIRGVPRLMLRRANTRNGLQANAPWIPEPIDAHFRVNPPKELRTALPIGP